MCQSNGCSNPCLGPLVVIPALVLASALSVLVSVVVLTLVIYYYLERVNGYAADEHGRNMCVWFQQIHSCCLPSAFMHARRSSPFASRGFSLRMPSKCSNNLHQLSESSASPICNVTNLTCVSAPSVFTLVHGTSIGVGFCTCTSIRLRTSYSTSTCTSTDTSTSISTSPGTSTSTGTST
jgi:hypothetical protein